MSNKITKSKIHHMLDFAYDKAVNGGIIGLKTSYDIGNKHKDDKHGILHQCDKLIRKQNLKAALSGFVTGLGGLFLLPITLPANVSAILYIQIRMIASIAHLGGYDLQDEKVKTMVYVCLIGDSAMEVLKNAGIVIAEHIAINVVTNVSKKTMIQLNQKIIFKLVAKFGEKSLVNIVKAIPLLGGFIGGSIDAFSTNAVGKVAKRLFIGEDNQNHSSVLI